MVALSESARVMKVVLTVADIATIFLLWKWLRRVGLNEWLVLTYAWNPVIPRSRTRTYRCARHVLDRRRCALDGAPPRALAIVAPSLAVATKLLPIVLAPLFIGRVRVRDLALGAAVLAALYLPFAIGTELPVGAVPNVVAHIRFNSPVFRPLAWIVSPGWAASLALDRDRRRGVGAREARHQ